MNVERVRLEELRDQALRDLIELDRQVGDAEIPPNAAAALRRGYEVTAARALAALDLTAPSTTTATRVRPRLSRARIVAYALTALAAVVAAAVLLPQFVAQRPAGGFVTGNEVAQAAPGVSSSQLDAQWFTANMQLYVLNDPAAALATLERIRRRTDLPPGGAQQVDELAAVARARLPGSRR
ncbi:MAG: hypothetical protein DLM60_05060 [Pseudonocardiales bacterium]|nr:hypothetical protein [Actinomycetota bacterium]PZS22033.1 MAG: hypothetical protein DLM60_05060 [Pseudonocardiales bacterium]